MNAKPFKYVARLDGQIVGKRKSPRTYTHAVVVKGQQTSSEVVAWCGRLDLAQTQASRRGGEPAGVYIVPAETL